MNSRPKPFETEEDILKQQDEFIKNKIPSSVKVIKDKNATDSNTPMNIDDNIKDENVVKDKNVVKPFLIGNIVERKTTSSTPISTRFTTFSSGFPQPKKRQIATNTHTHKGSIFSQQSKKIKELNTTTPKQHEKPKPDVGKILPSCSYILTGRESEEIHKENLNKLSEMSEQQILEERNKLLNSLDPDIVKFLKSKRNKTENVNMNVKMETEDVFTETMVDVEKIVTPQEIIEHSSEKWLHFNEIETEKMQWMKNIDIPKKLENGEPYEARFDFSGWLLPYVAPEISEGNRSLYHHGEEPGRPGYTLKELFKLCRSNVNQQRILSLNTISNILALQSTGVYDDIIEIPIEQIFFVLRICLDDNSPSILNASIKAMHHLFFYQIDEACLDSLTGFGLSFVQPMLSVDKEDNKEDEKEINDQQLAEMDLVKCLARTDILIRIRYIINTVRPTSETINYCLELLIRLMRDSHLIMMQVYNCEDLFKSVVQHFVPKIYKLDIKPDYCYGCPVLSAIKLLRISASRSKIIASELIQKYDVMNSICSYIANDIGNNTIGVKIQIEAFNLYSVFLYYNLGIEYFSELSPFLIRSVDYHLKNTNIDEKSSFTIQNHFASIMNIVSHATRINFNLITNFVPLLIGCFAKYSNQTSNLTDFKCGKLQIISSLLTALTNIIKATSVTNDSNVENIIQTLLDSTGFNVITTNIKTGSNLLCPHEPHKSGANLSSVEAAVWNTTEHIVPCLSTNSCIPFLTALSYFIETCSNEVMLKFLFHPNIQKYLTSLNTTEKFSLTSNWFTKMESQLLINILRCAVKSQKVLRDHKIFYELSVKSLNIFQIEQKLDADFILRNIVFNKQFYPKELLFDQLSLNEVVCNTLKYLEEIYTCYSDILGFKKDLFLLSSSLTIDNCIGNIVPVDWVFSPLVILYAEHQNTSRKIDEKREIFIVSRCLQWIFLYENYFPELSSCINPTDRFCRLGCVFLCDNSLFLEDEIHQLLELCFKDLLKPDNFNNINFDKQIQGLNNFQDFYVQLLEQYQGVSYGNALFANFILVPLIQKQNVKWRKIFWSEYMGAAQTITLDLNQCLIPINEFLNPPEEELSVLKCYKRALTSNYLKRSVLLQSVAQHHLDYYIKNKQ